MSSIGKIEDCMLRINGLVPKDVCNYFIEIFEKYPELHQIEGSYKYKTQKRENDNFKNINLSALEKINSSFKEPHDLAKKFISIMITNYVFHVQKNICPSFSNQFFTTTNNIRILRYRVGESIKDHSDVGPNIRASCTLNLNEDYEGGEFRFFDGRKKETFKTGDGMIFPAEPIWVHGTEPVIKGTRYSINCFLHS
tara:strand:- start:44 stop:631 length:588 start_codon:yes stop_codon:yes gene_type:complete